MFDHAGKYEWRRWETVIIFQTPHIIVADLTRFSEMIFEYNRKYIKCSPDLELYDGAKKGCGKGCGTF